MDSLVANYASSDEEEDHRHIPIPKLPSYIGFSNLPIPKIPSSSPRFSSLPIPKSENPRRVVQFRPPIKAVGEDQEDDDELQNPKKRSRGEPTCSFSSSVKSLLSSLPPPKNSLSLGSGAVAPPPSTISGRRAAVDTQPLNDDSNNYSNPPSEAERSDSDPNYAYYEGYVAVTETPSWNEEIGIGRRGRREIPKGIVEVSQDELMKNRPRQDQSKLKGIAFGPSYEVICDCDIRRNKSNISFYSIWQPAPTKGKPSKLHKRKHQIGSLYFEMKQNEMELSERRSRGMLTKSETQAKYGW